VRRIVISYFLEAFFPMHVIGRSALRVNDLAEAFKADRLILSKR